MQLSYVMAQAIALAHIAIVTTAEGHGGMTYFGSDFKSVALSFTAIVALLVIFSLGALSSKSVTQHSDFSSPPFQATIEELREEQVISRCDQHADRAQLSESDRMDFMLQCLVTNAKKRS